MDWIEWFSLLVGVCSAAATITVPGALVGLVARVPGQIILLTAVPLSVSIIALAGVVGEILGIKWGFLAVLLLLGVFCLVALVLRYFANLPITAKPEKWVGGPLWLVYGCLIGGGTHVFRLLKAIGNPSAVSQTYDSPFHLNLVEAFVNGESGSSVKVNLMNTQVSTGGTYYPAAWHDWVSLVVKMTGIDIPIASNAAMILLVAVIWPVGVGALTATVSKSWKVAGITATVSCLLPQMPNHLTWFGILLPTLFAFILIPYFLAILVAFFTSSTPRQAIRILGLFILAIPGLIFAHANGFFALALIAFPLFTVFFLYRATDFARSRSISPWPLWAGVIGTMGAIFIFGDRLSMIVPAFAKMRTGESTWAAHSSVIHSIVRAITSSAGWSITGEGIIPALLSVIILIGVVYSFRNRDSRWLPFSYAVVIFLYVVSSSTGGAFRQYIVGLWYGDTERLVALIGVIAVPLLGLGTASICAKVSERLCIAYNIDSETRHTKMYAISTVVVVFLVFCLGQLGGALRSSYQAVEDKFAFLSDNPDVLGLVSVDEYTLMKRLSENVGDEEAILGNPWNGSVFAPAIGHVNFAFPHLADSPDQEAMYVVQNLWYANINPEVCEIVNRRNFGYVLDFGKEYLWGGDPNGKSDKFPEVDDLEIRGLGKVIDQEGEAKLIKITACD